MKKAAENIQLVESRSNPTEDQISQYEKYANTSVSTQEVKEWYVLLRQTQGQLQPFVEDLKYMINSSGFLLDSLFCEYGYIINLDTNKLEFYKGFNKNKDGAGRYASLSLKEHTEYYGVELIAEFELANIQADPEGNWIGQMNKLTQEDEAEEEIQIDNSSNKLKESCPTCKDGNLIVMNSPINNNQFLACDKWPKCNYMKK